MALSYSVTPIRATPSPYSANTHNQIKFIRSLGSKICFTNQLNNNNVLADLVKQESLHHHKHSLTVRSAKKADSVAQPTTTEVVLVDGLEPAILNPPIDLKRSDFPSYFKFGASTTALQTEGSGTEGGRGKATWDFKIEASKGRKAVDSYNMFTEDVKLLKAMGMNSYSFSIAWPRILPNGTEEDGPINQEGIDFYNKLINALLAERIEPIITLFHFDLPVALQNKYNGFMSSQIVEDFKKYADICFTNFGDRVKLWSTINVPYVFGSIGYQMGLPEDVQNDPLGRYIATHNIILAHAAAAQLYHDNYQKRQNGKIGISLACKWYEPYSSDPKDVNAAQMQMDFMVGWYMDPFVNGDYPKSMKETVRGLPEFTMQEKRMVRNACDYIGISYFTARYAKQTSAVDPQRGLFRVEYLEETADVNGNIIGEEAEGKEDILVYPVGLKKLLLYITNKYDAPELYVTENGLPAMPTITGYVQDSIRQGKTEELKTAFFDDRRISHAEDHLTSIREARMEGANVRGYFVYTLMDNLEIGSGYDVRFGLNYTDYYDNHKRYPKKSAKWFARFLAEAPKEPEN